MEICQHCGQVIMQKSVTEVRIRRAARNEKIIADFKLGLTLQQCAEPYGLSREYVRRLLQKNGVDPCEGGRAIRKLLKADEMKEKARALQDHRELMSQQRWGMTYQERNEHIRQYGNTAYPNSPMRRFCEQRNNVRRMGVAFKITFKEWWRIWQESGLWDKRVQDQLELVRYASYGDFEANNVRVCSSSERAKEHFLMKPKKEKIEGDSDFKDIRLEMKTGGGR